MNNQAWFLLVLLAIDLASVVWCWLEIRRSPIDPPWADEGDGPR